jgi:hypothetical protein
MKEKYPTKKYVYKRAFRLKKRYIMTGSATLYRNFQFMCSALLV